MITTLAVSVGWLALSALAAAQEPEPTIQALLKEVHALRVAMEQSNQIAPRIQIVLARIQLQDERVRTALRNLQDARDKISETQARRAEISDRIKQSETQQTQTADPTSRKQLEFEATEMKAAVERLGTLEQQWRSKEAEANSIFLTEQAKWHEANDKLSSIERDLATRHP